jgi:hypothetical protein
MAGSLSMAMLLIRRMGRPAASSAKGIREPKGKPVCFLEIVESVAIDVSESSVRIRSAWLGSGSRGSAVPVGACWRGALVSRDDIGFPNIISFSGLLVLPLIPRHRSNGLSPSGPICTPPEFQRWFMDEIRIGMGVQREEQADIPIHVMPNGDTAGARGAALEALKFAHAADLPHGSQ